MHPQDAEREGFTEGEKVRVVSLRGACILEIKLFEGVKRGVLVSEGLFPNSAHEDGKGINTLTSASATAPHGGASFHDNKVRIERY